MTAPLRSKPASIASLEALLDPVRDDLARRAAAAALIPLGPGPYPDEVALEASRSAAELTLRQGFFEALASRHERPSCTSEEIPPDGRARGLSPRRLAQGAALPPLLLPPPEDLSSPSPSRVAFAAAAGALGGAALGGTLAPWAFLSPQAGLVAGIFLGAWTAARGMGALDEASGVRRLLALALGVATLGEGWGLMTERRSSVGLWHLLEGRSTGLRRLSFFVALTVLFFLTRRPRRFSPAAYERVAKNCALQWLEGALRGVAFAENDFTLREMESRKNLPTAEERALLALAEEVRSWDPSSLESIPQAWEDLHREMESQGISGEKDLPTHWEEGMEDHYETFGQVAPGDPLRIERAPVFFEGVLKRRGLARRDRSAS